jgi:hypothetical protein
VASLFAKYCLKGDKIMSTSPSAKPSSTTAVIIALYMIVLAVLMFCGGAGVTFLGSLATSIGTSSSSNSSAVSTAGGLLTLLGIGFLLLALGSLVVAIGLFMRKPWSYMGIFIVNGIYIAIQLLSMLAGSGGSQVNLGGSGTVSLLFIAASAACIFFALTDKTLKAALEN